MKAMMKSNFQEHMLERKYNNEKNLKRRQKRKRSNNSSSNILLASRNRKLKSHPTSARENPLGKILSTGT